MASGNSGSTMKLEGSAKFPGKQCMTQTQSSIHRTRSHTIFNFKTLTPYFLPFPEKNPPRLTSLDIDCSSMCMSEASMFVWTCTSRHARWTSLIIQWSPDSTDCFNKRQLSSRVARRTLLSTQTHNVCAVRIYTVFHIINKWITKMCVC